MAVARVTEIISSSNKGFEAATADGIKRANKTLKNITGAWVKDHKVVVEDGKIKEYRIGLMVTFILKDGSAKRAAIIRLRPAPGRHPQWREFRLHLPADHRPPEPW